MKDKVAYQKKLHTYNKRLELQRKSLMRLRSEISRIKKVLRDKEKEEKLGSVLQKEMTKREAWKILNKTHEFLGYNIQGNKRAGKKVTVGRGLFSKYCLDRGTGGPSVSELIGLKNRHAAYKRRISMNNDIRIFPSTKELWERYVRYMES